MRTSVTLVSEINLERLLRVKVIVLKLLKKKRNEPSRLGSQENGVSGIRHRRGVKRC